MLSTPPAFILSQDQTLMLKFVIFRCPVQFFNWQINRINLRFIPLNVIERIYCFKVVSFKETFVCCYYSTLKFIESFKVISLFNYQSSFLSAVVSFKRQLIYYITFKLICQQLFWKSFSDDCQGNSIPVCHLLSFSTRQLSYINISNFVCQQLFQKKIEQIIFSNKAEKEGFEPSRRLPDLYP